MEENTGHRKLTPLEAWADFCQKYDSLTSAERGRLGMGKAVDVARRDGRGERIRAGTGKPYGLGPERIAKILEQAQKKRPDVFVYRRVVVEFYEVGKTGKTASGLP